MSRLCPDNQHSELFALERGVLPESANACFDEYSFYLVYVFISDFILGFCWVYCAMYLSVTLNRDRRLFRLWVWEIWTVVIVVGGARLLLIWMNGSRVYKYFHLLTYLATIPTAAAAIGGPAYLLFQRPFDAFVAFGDHLYHRLIICTRWKIYSEGADLNRRFVLEEWPDIRRDIEASLKESEKKMAASKDMYPDSFVVSRILVSINEKAELCHFYSKRKVDPTMISETPRHSAILPSEGMSYFELVTKRYPGSGKCYYFYADYRNIGLGLSDEQKRTVLWMLNVVNHTRQKMLPVYRCANVLESSFPRQGLLPSRSCVDLTSNAAFLAGCRRRRRTEQKEEQQSRSYGDF